MNEHDIINVNNLSFKKSFDMGGKVIKNLGDGNENGDAVNVEQLNNSESTLANKFHPCKDHSSAQKFRDSKGRIY